MKDDEHDGVTGKEEPASPSAAKKIRGNSVDVFGAENINRVRDILVGPQIREVDKRLARLEKHVSTEIAKIWGDTEKRIDSVEGFIKKDAASLSDKLKKDAESFAKRVEREHADRTESLAELVQRIQETNDGIQELRNQVVAVERQLHEQLLEQSKTLREEYRQQNDAISDSLDRAVEELRIEKTDRVALAALFAEVSARLTESLALNFGDETEG